MKSEQNLIYIGIPMFFLDFPTLPGVRKHEADQQ